MGKRNIRNASVSGLGVAQPIDGEKVLAGGSLGAVRFVDVRMMLIAGSLGVVQSTDGEGCVGVGRLDNGRGGPIGFDWIRLEFGLNLF